MTSSRPGRSNSIAIGVALALLIGAALAGCGRAAPGSSTGGLPPAAATSWTLTSLTDAAGTVTDPAPAPTLDLSDPGRASGSDGCAPFSGTAQVRSATETTADLRFADLVSPAIGCLITNGIETRYGSALSAVRTLSVASDALTLVGGGTTLRFTRGARTATPAPGLTTGPTPGASGSVLPAGMARIWALDTDPHLRIDLFTPGAIAVAAGCPSFTGDLAVLTTSSAGSVSIRITRRPDTGVHCLAITPGEQEFVSAVGSGTTLRTTASGLVLDGTQGTLSFVPAS